MTDIQRNLGIGVVLAALLGGVVYMLATRERSEPAPSGATTSATTEGGVTGSGGGYTIERVDGVPPPSLDRPLTISSSLPADAQEVLRSNMQTLVAQLKADTTRVDLWLKLGIHRKIAEDYEGAAQAWEYVALTAPGDLRTIAYGNLADLYQNFLKDPAKAKFYADQAAKF